MLATTYQQELSQLLDSAECEIKLPVELYDLFQRRGPLPAAYHELRRFNRAYFPTKSVLQFSGQLPAIPREPEPHCVYTKDLSRNGISFFHSQPLYPGEVVTLWLAVNRAVYRVVRCRRMGPRCFEIGATLNEP